MGCGVSVFIFGLSVMIWVNQREAENEQNELLNPF